MLLRSQPKIGDQISSNTQQSNRIGTNKRNQIDNVIDGFFLLYDPPAVALALRVIQTSYDQNKNGNYNGRHVGHD